MTDEIDQDVREAAYLWMVNGEWDEAAVAQSFARMKEAGRQQGLREAAEVARDGCRCRTCGAYFLGSNGHECERPDWDGLVGSVAKIVKLEHAWRR
ncbi:hypothetical protein, partial [Sphingobium sp. DC-2]|uniref:hypothetical protein n=1 Tax=Sphingobium sp. DC-2 TaxID=1303256 RepID=UPI0005679190